MRVYKITIPRISKAALYTEDIDSIKDEIDSLEIGDTLVVEAVETEEASLKKLPEFDGW